MSSKTLMLAALAGLAIGQAHAEEGKKPAAPATKEVKAAADTKPADEVLCYGVNDCGGKSVCGATVDMCSGKTSCEAKTQCGGKNSCKGKGVLKMDKQACADKGGKVGVKNM